MSIRYLRGINRTITDGDKENIRAFLKKWLPEEETKYTIRGNYREKPDGDHMVHINGYLIVDPEGNVSGKFIYGQDERFTHSIEGFVFFNTYYGWCPSIQLTSTPEFKINKMDSSFRRRPHFKTSLYYRLTSFRDVEISILGWLVGDASINKFKEIEDHDEEGRIISADYFADINIKEYDENWEKELIGRRQEIKKIAKLLRPTETQELNPRFIDDPNRIDYWIYHYGV